MVNAMEIKFHAVKTWENFTLDMKFCTEKDRYFRLFWLWEEYDVKDDCWY